MQAEGSINNKVLFDINGKSPFNCLVLFDMQTSSSNVSIAVKMYKHSWLIDVLNLSLSVNFFTLFHIKVQFYFASNSSKRLNSLSCN